MRESLTSLMATPQDGCYIRGLFVEGARWDASEYRLAEARPKELYTDMPIVWLMPVANRKPPTSGIYDCPVYKTLTRAGRRYFHSRQSSDHHHHYHHHLSAA